MQKMLTQLEFKTAEKVYHFICDPTSPLTEVKEALFQFMKYIGSIEDAIRAQQAQAESQKVTPLPQGDLPVTDEVKKEAA